MAVIINFYTDIKLVGLLQKCAKHIQEIMNIEDKKRDVTVYLTAAPYVAITDSNLMWGCFNYAFDESFILISCGLNKICEMEGMSEKEVIAEIVNTLIHELCHYEQWLAGKPLTERGVVVRTRNVYKKLIKIMPELEKMT